MKRFHGSWIGRAVVAAAVATAAACGGESPAADVDDGVYVPENVLSPGIPITPALNRTSTDIFPATGQRGLVLNNCATCHAVACAAIGQRTDEEWLAVEESHTYYIPGLSKEDFGKIFDYLKRHFNDRTPEPDVPADLLGDGCPRLEPGAAAH